MQPLPTSSSSSRLRLRLRRLVLLLFLFLLETALQAAVAAIAMATTSNTRKQHRVALVTGANKGIGKEIVRLLLSSSHSSSSSNKNDSDNDVEWTIFLASRDVNQGNAAIEDILRASSKTSNNSNSKHRIICTRLDLTDPASIQSTKELIEQDEIANGSLHVLINNAAICFNDPTLYGKVPYTPFQQQADITVRTNFFGTLHVIQTMLPLLLQKSSLHNSPPACIINIASSAGRLSILKSSRALMQTFTSPDLTISQLEAIMQDFIQAVQDGSHADKGYPNTCYGMSKCGIIALTRILARQHAADLLAFYSVDPGYCATDQNNNQGMLPTARGAVTPVWLATMPAAQAVDRSGRHFFQEQEIAW